MFWDLIFCQDFYSFLWMKGRETSGIGHTHSFRSFLLLRTVLYCTVLARHKDSFAKDKLRPHKWLTLMYILSFSTSECMRTEVSFLRLMCLDIHRCLLFIFKTTHARPSAVAHFDRKKIKYRKNIEIEIFIIARDILQHYF